MATWRWTFAGPDSASYTFEINPSKGGSPTRAKTLGYSPRTAGGTIVFEGADAALTASVSGKVRSEAAYDAFLEWFEKRTPVTLTDDLGRQFVVYLTRFAPERSWKVNAPWHHDYTLDYLILEEL